MTKQALLALALLLTAPLTAKESADGERPEHRPTDRGVAWFRSHDVDGDGKICDWETDLPATLMERADKDGDGCLSAEEAGYANKQGGHAVFSRLDANGDGLVCRDEVAGTDMARRLEAAFSQHDANGDGCISHDEMGGMGQGQGGFDQGPDPAAMLHRMDRNQDGLVCRDELPHGPTAGGHGPQQGADQQGGAEGGGPQGRGHGGMHGPPDFDRFFSEHDANGDGCLSRDELPRPHPWTHLRRLDANGDGLVCRDEIPQGQPAAGPGRQAGPAGGSRQGGGAQGRGPAGNLGPPDFARLFSDHDANGDGCLSKDELPDPNRGRLHARLSDMDTNADGKVDRSEWKGPEEAFDRLDKNDDGLLSHGEWGPPDGETPPVGGDLAGNFLARHDANGDGQVTRSEFPGPDTLFDRLDKNDDGVVEKSDLS